MRSPIARLTKPQRAALDAIAAGGAERQVGSYDRKVRDWTAGGTRLPSAVVDRLRDAGLVEQSHPPKSDRWRRSYDLIATARGRDLLAGIVRPPLTAVITICVDGEVVKTVTALVDPYEYESWDEAGREQRLARTAEMALREHVAVAVHIGDEDA